MKKFVVLALVVVLGSVVFLGGNVGSVALANNANPQEVMRGQGEFHNNNHYNSYCDFGPGSFKEKLITTISELTGLKVEEIEAKRAEGKTLATIASEHGISKEEIVENILSERKAWLDTQVDNNNMTEEKAARCLLNLEQKISTELERTSGHFFGKGMGAKKGMHRGMHNGFGNGACLNQY